MERWHWFFPRTIRNHYANWFLFKLSTNRSHKQTPEVLVPVTVGDAVPKARRVPPALILLIS